MCHLFKHAVKACDRLSAATHHQVHLFEPPNKTRPDSIPALQGAYTCPCQHPPLSPLTHLPAYLPLTPPSCRSCVCVS